jgi:hypothetical protein
MKRIALLITAALMVFSFGQAFGNSVTIDNVLGTWDSGTKVGIGNVEWFIRLTVTGGGGATAATGTTNGFQVYLSTTADGLTPDAGGTYGPLTIDQPFTEALWVPLFDGGRFYNTFSCNGTGADTIGYGNFKIFGSGMLVGYDEVTFHFTSSTNLSEAGKYLCLDSSFYPPGGAWLWSFDVGSAQPTWGGPYCWLIEEIPNLPPQFDNCPAVTQSFSHCVLATVDLDATDPEPDPITYNQTSGPGTTDPNTGVWSYQPNLGDVGATYTIVVEANDAFNSPGDVCSFDVTFTNLGPTISGACGTSTPVGKGNPISIDFDAVDGDCDPISFYIAGVVPAPVGTYGINAATGELTFNTDIADGGVTYTFTVCATDGIQADDDCCDADIEVLETEPFEVQIQKTHNTPQGLHELVNVYLNKGSEDIWGFDFLIAYDASALSFQTALEGDIYALCGWEYFTYRYGPNGNCGNACPSGLLRVVGLAETNNGFNHPDCWQWDPKPWTFFTLDFLVTDDRTFECQYVPIRFYWMDCGDNTISFHESQDVQNPYSQKLAISRYVFDIGCQTGIREITDPLAEFPTYFGAPDICLDGDKDVPVRFIDFINGGIDIVCADSIDARGDLNLNGIANEIADAVLYTNYFVYGAGVLTPNYNAKVAASDVNADGIPLSVADLVYLIRIVVGDALPYPKIHPVEAEVAISQAGEVSVNAPMGAAALVIDGQVAPQLLVDNMELKYAFDEAEGVTRAIVYSYEPNQTFEGAFIDAQGEVLSVEMATYEGARVNSKVVPTDFALHQNYPNPFNPTTTVGFALPRLTDWTLTIYNVTGQEVDQFSGRDQGTVEQVIDAGNWSSGIYFYKLDIGTDQLTRKMILVK